MGKYQYLCAYSVPLLVVASGYLGGLWLLTVPLYVFGVVPLVDLLLGTDQRNPPSDAYDQLKEQFYYRFLTWAFVPLQWALIFWAAYTISSGSWSTWEAVLFTLSVGISSGGVGITLAHELGHRSGRFEQWLAQTLLLSVTYMHFFIEHNLGHHRHVATVEDPASSRYGESLYRFLPRTLLGSWFSAWAIESKMLQKKGQHVWSLSNRMIYYALLPMLVTAVLVWAWGLIAGLFFLGQSLVAILLLETINYVEHYGLERQLRDGRPEKVQPHHSWNASQWLTNALLFNLQRHSDHHANANRRYQTLRHFDDVPQLPTGYAGMVLLALVPPLWFATMNPRVNRLRGEQFA